jgi:predicted dehydrogenase
MPAATFAVIGAGYRAQYFLRIARALPERFRVQAMVVRAPDAAAAMAAAWDVKVHPSLEALLAAGRPDFLVVSVSPGAATALLRQAAAAGLPVLTETPPATSLDGLLEIWRLVEAGARIHVAEQYPRQPLNAARLALVHAGRLGRITSAQIGVAHAYHGVSLLRAFLGVGFAPARISARGFTATVATPPDRQGPPRAPGMVEELQVIAQLDFGDRLGITDFTGGQYRSWIRAARFLVRGDHGEIKDTELRYLKDYRTSVELELRRIDTGQNGSPENYWHRGIMAGADWVYETPYPGVTLGDDEIAGAQLLDGMVALCGGGAGPYPFAEAAQDQYLALAIEQARSTGGIVTTAIQPWAESAGR